MKTCCVCKQSKELNRFHKNKDSKDGRQRRCAECATTANIARYKERKNSLLSYQQEYDKLNRERIKVRKAMKVYGLSEKRVKELFKIKCCEICGKEKPLNIDHCHDSLKVRGMLCTPCNTALGSLRDSKDLLLKAINYIDTHQASETQLDV